MQASMQASILGSMLRPDVSLLVLIASGSVAAAGPRWLSGPDRAYNCTHYLEGSVAWNHPAEAKPGEAMSLVLPVDKIATFTLSAQPAKKGHKLTYAIEGAPPGAKLVGSKFEWKVAGAPGQRFQLVLVATEDDASARWPISVRIADAKLFAAWSAGMGSVFPDCSVYPADFDVEDLDGDGKDDVIYGVYAGSDGTIERHVMLQRGTMKFVEATTCLSCSPVPDIASDGTRLLIVENDCCCVLTFGVQRLDGDSYVSARDWQVPGSCAEDPTTITLERDANHHVSGAIERSASGKVVRYVWKAGTFQDR
jgi:hypothetical protein